MYYLNRIPWLARDLDHRFLIVFAAVVVALCWGQSAAADEAVEFRHDLAQGYAEIAKFVDLRAHDAAGQSYFENKSERARALYAVDPEWPTNWSITPATQQLMMRDRRDLVAALARLKGESSPADPKTGAIAQVNFDCWVAFSSVPSLGPESERCGKAFHAALQQIKGSE